jgi:PEP-CTERM motif
MARLTLQGLSRQLSARKLLVLALLSVCGTLAANADVVLLGATNPGQVGAALNTTQAIAQPFTLTQAVRVSSVDVLLEPFLGGAGQETFQLTNSIGPGTTAANVLASQTFSVPVLPATGTTFSMTASLTLLPGTYYLVVSSPDSAKNNGVVYATSVLPSTVGSVGFALAALPPDSFVPSSTFTGFAPVSITFDVVGSQIPEPATMLLFGTGMTLCSRLKKRVRQR